MIKFKDLFRFSQREVSYLFETAKLKTLWRGLKLLQAPLNSLEQSEDKAGSSEYRSNFGKLLIITPAACGRATQRNLFRRRVKSIFYTQKLYLYPVNSILIVRRDAMALSVNQLETFLKNNISFNAERKTGSCKNTSPKLRLWQRFFIAIFDTIRPVFGFMGISCIYPVSCSDYAKHVMETQPFYKSIPLITLRVLSCNPLTALYLRWKNRRK